MKNNIKAILTFILTLIVLMGCVCTANAEGVDIEALKEKCAQLPTVKTLSIEHKDLIVEVKAEYDKLSITEKGQLGADNLAKISEITTAFEPLLLGDTVTRTNELPEKIKKKHKKEVVAIYKQYSVLSDEAKESFDATKFEKLNAAVKELAPELLGEGEAGNAEQKTEQTSSQTLILGMYIWEFVIIVFLALVTLLNIALIVLVAIKVLGKH